MFSAKSNTKIYTLFSALIALVMLSITVLYITDYTEEKLALRDSERYTALILEMQKFYASEIASHATKNGIKLKKDYKKMGTAIPYPATFVHEFVKTLNTKNMNINFNFYSDKPFYKRIGGGPRDEFEWSAINYFTSSNKNTLYKIEEENGVKYFRYAQAVRLSEECIVCHNSHPDSPYKHWKAGDFRGIHSLKIKIPGVSLFSNNNFNPLNFILVSLYLLICTLAFLLFFALHKLQNERNQKEIIQNKNKQIASAKEEIEETRNNDLITGLMNRTAFYGKVEKYITNTDSQTTAFSVLILNIDNFKNINTRYGQIFGNTVLREVANRLKSIIQKENILSRLGNDEYGILVPNVSDVQTINNLINRILGEVEQPVKHKYTSSEIALSIGISRYPLDGKATDVIMENANLALNKAKSLSREKSCFFNKEIQNAYRESDKLETDLKEAIEKNELEIFYQPKISLTAGEIVGFEALIRWPHVMKGFISPDEFLPIAEERGLILPICRYVTRKVAHDMSTWLDERLLKGRIAVNIHAEQLKNIEEMELVIDTFDEFGIPSQYLTLEITEGCVMGKDAHSTLEVLELLNKRDMKISLDDFGTGYASLTHLKDLPVQEVKIDKSFIDDITTNPESEAIVCAIIDISQKIGLEVVAEGIETHEQLSKLKEMGCNIGQGYIFSPPSIMVVANGLLSLPNLFRDLVINGESPQPISPQKKIV